MARHRPARSTSHAGGRSGLESLRTGAADLALSARPAHRCLRGVAEAVSRSLKTFTEDLALFCHTEYLIVELSYRQLNKVEAKGNTMRHLVTNARAAIMILIDSSRCCSRRAAPLRHANRRCPKNCRTKHKFRDGKSPVPNRQSRRSGRNGPRRYSVHQARGSLLGVQWSPGSATPSGLSRHLRRRRQRCLWRWLAKRLDGRR